MVLHISTFNKLSEQSTPAELSEYGVMTIHCTEVEEREAYLQLRVLDKDIKKSANRYDVPIRNKANIFSIADRGYEICAIYKMESAGDRTIDVIFLYALDEDKTKSLQPVPASDYSEFYFARPGLTVTIALKYFNK